MISDSTDEQSPIWFALPDCFIPMGLDQDPEQRMPQLIESLEQVAPQMTDDARLQTALVQEATLKHMWDQGVRYAATCLLRGGTEEEPRLTTGQFTVTIILADLPGTDPLRTLQKSLTLPGKKRETALDELPTGQALLVVDETETTLPSGLYGTGDDTVHTTRQVQAFIPLPDGNRIAALALSTESLQDWEDYTTLMREILATVSFRHPATTSSIEDKLTGL